jgi:hypothetical protein
VVSPEDVQGIAALLVRFVEAKRAGRLSESYDFTARRTFERRDQAKNLAALLEQIAPRHAGGGA